MNAKALFALSLIPISSSFAASVILNEYNGVSDTDQLDGGSGSDSFFGNAVGNGGDWFELVVLGDGTSGSSVDMRGWRIELFDGDDGASTITLSQDSYWENVPAGTILTFIENDSAGGGLDSGSAREDRLNSEGWVWTNVYIGDNALIDLANSDADIHLSNSDTDITIKDATASIVFGPAGEAIADNGDGEGVNSEEALALQTSPTTSILPGSLFYNDVKSSTFGSPNHLESGSANQSFLAFRTPGPAPSFTTPIPNSELLSGQTFTTSTSATDANGGTLTISIANGPAWLNIQDNGDGTADLSGTPTLADAGLYDIELSVTDDPLDGTASLEFEIRVFPTPSPVVLNEYNAEGGWFELVVVGDGTPGSTVDLREWVIHTSDDNGQGAIYLSDNSAWSAIQAGTILLFSEDNAALGGFDTDFNYADNLSNSGWATITIWTGDSTYLNAELSNETLFVSNDDTTISIEDENGNIIFGPAGEGIASENGIGSEERFQLTVTPSPTTSPIGGDYDESTSSTPGAPNSVPGGSLQVFESYATGSETNSAPFFTNNPSTLNDYAVDIPNFYLWVIYSEDPNPSDNLTFSLLQAPSWLQIEDFGDGSADLYGTPEANDAGPAEVEIQVSDGSLTATQRFVVFAFNETSPVIVNEFNAVDGDLLLDGGDSHDSFWGPIEGNGGDWLELVVVGDGTAGSTVDLRGWTIEIGEGSESPENIVLSQDPYWQTVQAGTILTFTDQGSHQGGLDSAIHRVSRFDDGGWAWTNILVTDSMYVDQEASDFGGGFSVGNSDTRITLLDESGAVRFGPAGEEFFASGGLGDDEIYKLEQDPSPSFSSPLLAAYTDGSSSTFGAPNQWNSGADTQSFSDFETVETPNAQPFFNFTAPQFARRGDAFSSSITAEDSDGPAGLTISLESGPAWMNIVDHGDGSATLSGTPPSIAPLGLQSVSVTVSDGTATTASAFSLFVMNGPAPVLLNEYNAVDDDSFLNGGSAIEDDEGGTASDPTFGRILGNGGDWFELVVVGSGTAGTVDLRGWSITVADNASFPFEAEETITLSQDEYWAEVPTGTILTFTEKRTVEGGLDTALNSVDFLDSAGWTWSNIWIGDPDLIMYSDESTNGYSIDENTGEVSGISVSKNDTWFMIYNDVDEPVFGPVGEGIAPLTGVGGTEIFELEGNPVPSVSPLLAAADTPIVVEGYDDGSASTFGRPNSWNNDTDVQDFTAFIPSMETSAFHSYLSDFGLSGDDLLSDSDSDEDGSTQLHEFAFGSNPTSGTSLPSQIDAKAKDGQFDYLTLTFLRRTGGTTNGATYTADEIIYTVSGSLDLVIWNQTVEQTTNPIDLPTPPADYEWVTFRLAQPITGEGSTEKGFLRVDIEEE
tara:strand:+ start:37162 stop:41271 length:4110 start_codon:yes stop_codon:yes gene_type:complete